MYITRLYIASVPITLLTKIISMENTESNNPVVTPPAEDESKKESSAEKMPPPPSRQEQATIEKAEEVKLRAKYPQAPKPVQVPGGGPGAGGGGGHSAFLQKRLAKGQKYFDSGDYQMAKQKGPRGPAGRLTIPLAAQPPTGDTIPTPDTVPARKSSIIQPLHDHTRTHHPVDLTQMTQPGQPMPNPAITKLAS